MSRTNTYRVENLVERESGLNLLTRKCWLDIFTSPRLQCEHVINHRWN
jgi:hypothetical protein